MVTVYPEMIGFIWCILKVIFTACMALFYILGIKAGLIIFFALNIAVDISGFCVYKYHSRRVKHILFQYVVDKDYRILNNKALYINRTFERFFHLIVPKLNHDPKIKAAKKEAQYLALQNQINPHFLYNTLETIRSKAIIEGNDSVASMTEALATFFRYTISNLDSFVTVEDELNNVENYLIIQHYRFGEKITFRFEYDENEVNPMQLYVPKLILQPIVENAIYHGLEEKLGAGRVTIKIEKTERRLLITVVDNGNGMDEEQLEKINSRLRQVQESNGDSGSHKGGGIAVANVNNRIKLLFGDEYGLYFRSIQGIGTDAYISLPVMTSNSMRFYQDEQGNFENGARIDKYQ